MKFEYTFERFVYCLEMQSLDVVFAEWNLLGSINEISKYSSPLITISLEIIKNSKVLPLLTLT